MIDPHYQLKATLIALGMAWVVMAMVGCAGPSRGYSTLNDDSTQLYGDHSGQHYRQQDGSNIVRNQQTGERYYRSGSWLYNQSGTKGKFIYGQQVQE